MSAISLQRSPVASERLGRGRSTLHEDVRRGIMPPPIKVGSRWSAWPSDEVSAIARARIAGFSDDELRVLVKELVDRRKTAAPMQGRIDGLGGDDPARRHVSIEG